MAVQKTENSSVVERAVQWAKDVGGKIKTAVAEHKGASAYAKADKTEVKPHDASASTARAAEKFGRRIENFQFEHYLRPYTDDKIHALLQETLKDPKLKAHFEDVLRELDCRNLNH